MSWQRQMDHQEEEFVMEEDEHHQGVCHGDDDFEEESSTSGGDTRGSRTRQDDEQLVRWDKFLPKGSLTVLLLEGDDSTRHVIAALLGKCNYKVAAVSDGSKAWEILKERPQSIDLILAEVEVPSISGIGLLSMIMEHEICKNIPVIMMSSHDSINMVFKCMLQGAADFLVKPIRRNELRNLWQHVWRRHTSSDGHGGTKVNQDDNSKKKLESTSGKANQLNGFVPSVKNNKACSEKGSDAESSCTRSDMEAESTYKQNSPEPQQTTCNGFPIPSDNIRHNAEEKIQPKRKSLDHVSKHEGKSIMLGSECTPFNETSIANEQLLEEECSCALVETANEDVKPMGSLYNNSITNEMEHQTYGQSTDPKQIIDLIGAIDNQRRFGYGIRENTAINNNLCDAPEVVFYDEDCSCKSSSASFLELSLRRYPHTSVDKEEKNERSTLNHSNSSAFSLYNNRTPVSPFSTVTLQAEGEEYYSSSTKQIPSDKGFGNFSNIPRCTGTTRHINTEDAESPSFGASSKTGIAIKCSPIQVIPIPGGMNFDRSTAFHTGMQPFLCPESSGHLLWSANPSKGRAAVCMNAAHQSETKDSHTSHQHQLNQSPKRPILYSVQMEHRKLNTEQRDEAWHAASVMGDSASSSICYRSAGHIDSNGLGRIFNESNGNISHVAAELRNQEEKKSADLYRLNQREAALNKFRLKRKERCYEKKVRYQSRKRLAEQRPRVKGQFVRHIQPDAPSAEAASCPAVG